MKRSPLKRGFDYGLTAEIIAGYKRKPMSLRLEWLYQGNILRKSYPVFVTRKQDFVREGTRNTKKEDP